MKKIFATLLFLAACVAALAQQALNDTLARVLAANTHTFTLQQGQLQGPGAHWLQEQAQQTQFVALGEQHYDNLIPAFTTALFQQLQAQQGYQYFCTEEDPLLLWRLSQRKWRSSDSAYAYVRRYPQSLTFHSDQELDMLVDIARLSRAKANPLWGAEQAFGITHYLERLLPMAPTTAVRQRVHALYDSLYAREKTRMLDKSHPIATLNLPKDFFALRQLYAPKPGSEADFLITALEKSNEVYGYYFRARKGEDVGLYNNTVREAYMKQRLMDEYRYAEQRGDKLPKVLLKYGHMHLYKGLNPINTLSTGNFVHEFATSNRLQTLSLYTLTVNDSGRYAKWRTYYTDYLPFIGQVTGDHSIVDLRPLRVYAHNGKLRRWLGLSPEAYQPLARVIFGFDALLILRGSDASTRSKLGNPDAIK